MREARPAVAPEDVRAAASALGFDVTDAEAVTFADVAAATLASLDLVERMQPDPGPDAFPERRAWTASPGSDAFNAWATRWRVTGARDGPLAGWRVVVKENIALAGAPLTAGSRVLAGFAPERDAVVVTRTLRAGATIEGTATSEDLAFSSGSHTSAHGRVPNPFDRSRMAGGSSSGNAVLVATGAVRAAIGSDQGGSISIPSAHCGLVGVKPTHGRVPTTGSLSLDASLDHLGPMTRSVEDAARFLEVLAGEAPGAFTPRDDEAPRRVALVHEGFAWPDVSDARVDRVVEDAVHARFSDAGAHVTRAHVPAHRMGPTLMGPFAFTALARNLRMRDGVPAEREDAADPELARALHEGTRAHADALSPNVKLAAVAGHVIEARHGARPYHLVQRARRVLRHAFDTALADADVLALPAVPFPAPAFPRADAPLRAVLDATQNATANTATFDLTGHPVATVNAGTVDGLPVGVLLVARHGHERTLLAAARAFEARGERVTPPGAAELAA